MEDQAVLANEDAARRYAESIENPVVRNFVLMGLSHAKMRVARKAGQKDSDWRAQLPSEPLDMEFCARVLASMCSRPEILRAILDGKALAEASGWEI